MPVFSAALAVPFLGERLAWYHCAGGALVVLGILLARTATRLPRPRTNLDYRHDRTRGGA